MRKRSYHKGQLCLVSRAVATSVWVSGMNALSFKTPGAKRTRAWKVSLRFICFPSCVFCYNASFCLECDSFFLFHQFISHLLLSLNLNCISLTLNSVSLESFAHTFELLNCNNFHCHCVLSCELRLNAFMYEIRWTSKIPLLAKEAGIKSLFIL